MSEESSLLLVGCGKMGGVLLAGWLDAGVSPEKIVVVETEPSAAAGASARGVMVVPDAAQIPGSFHADTVIFAVKPQVMGDVAPLYSDLAGGKGPPVLFVSIAAGCKTAFLESCLATAGGRPAVVRAMPNTPASVRRGMTVCYATDRVTPLQHETCARLFEAVGDVAWVKDEELMDAVTAVSGSGPAYVFLLVECLANAGREAGLDADLAMALARATVSGSGELIARSTDPVDILRRNVTSPGGTTAAALDVLMGEAGTEVSLAQLMTRAVRAAKQRSKELSS